MNRKVIGTMILILILISGLNFASIIQPILAQNGENSILDKNSNGKANQTSLPNETGSPNRASGLNGNQREVSGSERYVKQDNPTLQTSPECRDKWNFNVTSEWSKYSYLNGSTTRLVVGFSNEKPSSLLELEKTTTRYNAKIVNTISIKTKVEAAVVELSLASVTAFVQEIRSLGLASYVEPNMKVQAQLFPNDPYWSLQWGLQKIGADWAWNTTTGSSDVLVAVVDTGIDYHHPDLAANYVPFGYDWVNNDTDPLDDFGHGTHCAGIIAAVLNNSLGIAGLAQVQIMAEKVLDAYGGGYADWIAEGIIDAVNRGAKIISMSLGGYGDSELIHDAVKYAYANGVLVIAAAGNDDTNMKSYPAAYDEVIAVAATDQYDGKAAFSNWGDWIELAAPGVSIYSTMPTYEVTMNWYGYSMNYDFLSGTSMACPHVAGVAALVWSRYPGKTRDWVRQWLRYTADDLGDPSYDIYYGYGRVNARKAVEQTPPTHELIAYDWRAPRYVEPGASGVINATILNFGQSSETDVAVQLLANGTIVDTKVISLLGGGNSTTTSLTWNPTIEAMYNVTLYVVSVPGETSVENNVLWKYIYVGFPVKAVVLHSAGNIDSGIITNWQALNNEWRLFGNTMVYIDYETLNKENVAYADIVATEADVLIISCAYDPSAGWEFTDSEIEAIARYVHEGHGLIVTAGTFYAAVPNNNKLAPLFGMIETNMWTSTGTDLLHLVNATHPIFDKVPDPLVFPEVGTVLPQDGQWDLNELNGGTYLALGHYRESAVVTYRGLVFISPWLEVIPPYYHHHLQVLYNAITWSRYQRPQHELAVSLQCSTHLRPGESVLVNATVENLGLNNETNVELFLLVDGIQLTNLTVPTLCVDESRTLPYLWTPTLGTYNITAYAPPLLGEEETRNNAKTTFLRVSYAAAIGLIETHGESLHSDFLKVYYEGLGHIVDTIYSTLTPELLASYDILIVGEDWSNTPWRSSEIEAVQGFIRSGKGFVAVGDELASSVQTIFLAYGIAYTGYYGYSGSSSNFDHSHPIMGGVRYIYASYPVNSLRAVAPGYWIANDVSNMYMLIAGAEAGGYVLCLSDDFAYDLYGDDNSIMFANMIDWMAFKLEHDLAVSLVAPAALEIGESTFLNATVRNRGLNNETGVELQLLINSALVSSVANLTLLVGESYTINFLWTPAETGNYYVTACAPPIEGEEKTTNNNVTMRICVFFYTRLYLQRRWIGGGNDTGWQADDASWQYTLPFDFPYYGTDYRTIYISSNGLITFLGPDSSWNNDLTLLAQKLAIAPAWNDWVTYYPYGIYVWENSTCVGIRWYVQAFGSGFVANFEAVLRADGVIQFDYDYNDGPVSATIGISNGAGHMIAEDVWSINQINTIVFLPFQLEHELVVQLQAPDVLMPGSQAILNASVLNAGLNEEAGVRLFLMLERETINSTLIPQLDVGASAFITYVWRPTINGVYNITAYVPPVPEEVFTWNNKVTELVTVRGPLIEPVEGQYASYALQRILIETGEVVGVDEWKLTYAQYVSPTRINITFWTRTQGGYEETSWMIVNIVDRSVESGLWVGMWYPGWIEKNITIGSTINLEYGTATVISSRILQVGIRSLDCWELLTNYGGYFWYDKLSGLLISKDILVPPWERHELMLLTTNVPIGFKHDLTIRLKAPPYVPSGTSLVLKATVYNTGLNNETDVRLTIMIDGSIVASAVIQQLNVGDSRVLAYPWTPLMRGTYNITAYAPPVPGETYTPNNVAERMVSSIRVEGTCIYVNPEESIAVIGKTLVINITLANVTDLYGWQIKLYYDEMILNFANASLPQDHIFSGHTISEVTPVVLRDGQGTFVLYGACLRGAISGVNGNGTLCQLEFDALALGFSPLDIGISDLGFTTFLYDSNMNQIAFTGLSGTAEVVEPSSVIHDIAVINVLPSATYIVAGQTVNVVVTVENQGDVQETFNVAAYYNSTAIGTTTVHKLGSGLTGSITFYWNTTEVAPGKCTISVWVDPVDGETNLENNLCIYGEVTVVRIVDDVAVVAVEPHGTWTYVGRSIKINVTVANIGQALESFNVTLYCNFTCGALVGKQVVTGLSPLSSCTLTFEWNTAGVSIGRRYTLTAVASTVQGERNITDNIMDCPFGFHVRLVGDTNGDNKVDIKDVSVVSALFGTYLGYRRWNPAMDLNDDGKVDIKDVAIVSKNFGRICP